MIDKRILIVVALRMEELLMLTICRNTSPQYEDVFCCFSFYFDDLNYEIRYRRSPKIQHQIPQTEHQVTTGHRRITNDHFKENSSSKSCWQVVEN